MLWTAIANIAGDCAALIPTSMNIEFIEQKNTTEGARLYREKADWHDQQVSKAVLGQTTTTDAISGGHAVSKEHRLVQEDIERHDAGMASASITEQLFKVMIGLNYPGAEDSPACHIGRPDEVPLSEVVNTISRLAPFGLRIRQADILQRLNLEAPKDGEPSIGATPAEAVQDGKPPTRSLEDSPDLDPALQSMMTRALKARAQTADPLIVQAIGDRLAQDAKGALVGLTHQVRAIVEEAPDLPMLMHRLQALELDPEQLTLAIQRGVAIAQLAGQASLLDEIKGGR